MQRSLAIEGLKNFRRCEKLWIGLLLIGLVGCKTDYEKLVDTELRKGIRKDSLFLGISLGMSSKDFYAHCWELNKRQVIRQGTRNMSVLFTLTDLKDTADMNFYPTFESDSIYEMPVYINYRGWAPWNAQLSSDTLVVDLIKMLKRWYGGDFIKLNFPELGIVFVKVDGNRRITVSRDVEPTVKVVFTDMLMEKRRKKKNNE